MANLYKLRNQIKHYEWGSTDLIPRLLGAQGDGSPWAELWMGGHADSPSQVSLPSGEVSLRELIASDPRRYLGDNAARQYGELPFLFKLLAVENPLSIQAHPNKAQAREGFAHDAHHRNYRDSNHKPEIFCALTPFAGMCGFRSPDETARLLAPLRENFPSLLRALETPEPAATALRNFLDALFGLSPAARGALAEFILAVRGEGSEWDIMRNLARQFPGDPAIIAPLYLNVFHLEPGEAIFLNAGVPHAYLHGFGVELMANSDNVLRGGLTSKHVDIPELMKVLDFTPMQPRVIKPEAGSGCFTYPAPCEEFSLTAMRGRAGGAPAALPRNAPAICIVTEGEAAIGDAVLKQGESAFIPADSGGGAPLVQGGFTLYAAGVPS